MQSSVQSRRLGFTKCPARAGSGNALTLVLAVGFFLLFVFLFALTFVRLLGSHQEQVTAIQSASLAAASDLSRIVIQDKNFGFISLSDCPPNGRYTIARDNYDCPVRSINTLLATIRLDMIVADQMHDKILMLYAQRDYANAMSAADSLAQSLNAAMAPSGTGKDKDGNTVNPFNDALAAYNANPVHLAEGTSTLVPGSFKLTLGYAPGITTNTPVPQPTDFANVAQDQQYNSNYRAYQNISYDKQNFVFSAVEDHTLLADAKLFTSNAGGLNHAVPSIVKCDADESFTDNAHNQRIIHCCACAEPGSLMDKQPAPSAMVVTFLNGADPPAKTLLALFTDPSINKSPTDSTLFARAGDAPPGATTAGSLYGLGTPHAPFGQTLRVALYDWLRANGPALNLRSLFDVFKQTFPSGSGSYCVMVAAPGGQCSETTAPVDPSVWLPVSDQQWTAVSGQAVLTSQNLYSDIFVTDYLYQQGTLAGGTHAGQALIEGAPQTVTADNPLNQIGQHAALVAFPPAGPAAGALRPSYIRTGVACEIRFRPR